MERSDDFKKRREHLRDLSDEQLNDRFWELVHKIIQPIIEEARTHTSPSIERSVLLRMGFSSIEAKAIVNRMVEQGVLGHGAGNLVLRLSQERRMPIREAGLALMRDEHWEQVGT